MGFVGTGTAARSPIHYRLGSAMQFVVQGQATQFYESHAIGEPHMRSEKVYTETDEKQLTTATIRHLSLRC